jgi:hypothetical protein
MRSRMRNLELSGLMLLLLGVVVCTEPKLSAQSFGANLGSLSKFVNHTGANCTTGTGQQGSYSGFEYTNFKYTPAPGVSGGPWSLPGTAWYVTRSTGGGGTCLSVGTHPATLSGGGYYIAFFPASNGGAGTANIFVPGYLNPKYIVVGVLYAPPGHNSSVTYTTSDLVSSTITTKSTFYTGYTQGSTQVGSVSLQPWKNTMIDGSVQNSTSYTNSTTTTDSTAITVQKTTTNNIGVKGPVCDYCGVDHDYDLIGVWLNPVVLYTLTNNGVVEANGYGFSTWDQPGVDVYYVMAGELNGDLPMRSSTTTAFARSWGTNLSYPTGGPGLTTQDEQNILRMDPFWNCTYLASVSDGTDCPEPASTSFSGVVDTNGTTVTWVSGTAFSHLMDQGLIVINGVNYKVSQVNSATSLTLATSAGTLTNAAYSAPSRFTQSTSTQFPYTQPDPGGQPQPSGYTWSYTNTFTTGTDVTIENDQTIGYEYSFGLSIFGIGFKDTINQSTTMKFIYETSSQFTSTSTSTAAASFTGPVCTVVGGNCNPIYPPLNAFNPISCAALSSATAFGQGDAVYIYQDNLFGTFLMEPYGQP